MSVTVGPCSSWITSQGKMFGRPVLDVLGRQVRVWNSITAPFYVLMQTEGGELHWVCSRSLTLEEKKKAGDA